MDYKLTAEFWDFIEKYIPEYSERDDVLRQSELRLYVDGHESSISGLTKEEAHKELNGILHNLFHEAIGNQVIGLGLKCNHCSQYEGRYAYCPDCGQKQGELNSVLNEIDPELRVTEEEGDTLDVQLAPERFPNTYQRKKKELMRNCGMSEEEAIKYIADAPIQVELFYSFDQGLFAVEAEGLDSIEIYNPYDGTEIPNDNLI